MGKIKKVAVLGASGSIGKSAADVLRMNKERFAVTALAANCNIDELAKQAVEFSPRVAVTASAELLPRLAEKLPSGVRAAAGENELLDIARSSETDILLCAIVGTAGIKPVLAAIEAGKTVALASKEVLVAAGELVLAELKKHPEAKIIPVDSEHSGVFQLLAGRRADEISRVWLTASGGPFRTWNKSDIERATVADALAHPTWSMGRKITIDSASMMNKALELVEAKFLFGTPKEKLGVLIQPQSIVHAMVELNDGSFLTQCAAPDMRLPIAYALSFPERMPSAAEKLDLASLGRLEFFAPDRDKFPSFDFADAALDAGGTLPCAMNAANEVAVELFCEGRINFGTIWKIVGSVMENWKNSPQLSVEQLSEADAEARAKAREFAQSI